MTYLACGAVRIVCVFAIFANWGFIPGVLALIAMLIPYGTTSWGAMDASSGLTQFKIVAGEIAMPAFGLWAIGSMWGAVWAAALLVIYVVAYMIPEN